MFWHLEQLGDSGKGIFDGDTREFLTYGRLLDQVGVLEKALLAQQKLLVLAFVNNSPVSLAAYLAALRSGHAVILAHAGIAAELKAQIIDAYTPEFILHAGHAPEASQGYQRVTSPVRGLAVDAARRPCAAPIHPDTAVLLSTSGTTGSPKLVRLSYGNLQSNAESICAYLDCGSDQVAMANLPMSYAYGLSVINSHLLNGANIVCTHASLVSPDFWRLFRERQCTSLAGVPYSYTVLEQLRLERMDLPHLRTLTQAGGPLPVDKVLYLARFAHDKGVRFFVMYGQTEATARISYVPPGRLAQKIGSVGVAIPNGRISVMKDDHTIADPGAEGEIIYHGPNVMLGHSQDRACLAKGDELHGRLQTGDLGYMDDEGFLFITGRRKRFIKMFGLRLNLDEIERKLESCFSRPVACVGKDDRLEIVVESPHAADAAEATRLVTRLYRVYDAAVGARAIRALPVTGSGKKDYAAIAREVTLLDAIPLTPNGKIDRRALPAPRAQRPSDGAARVEQRGPIQEQLTRIWREVLGLEHVGVHDNFFDLGGHSLRLLAVASRVEASLDVQMPLHRYFQRPTIAGLAALIAERLPSGAPGPTPRVRDDDHIIPLQRGGRRAPLFCVPAAGGHSFDFAPLARLLSPEQPVYGVQFQGMGMCDEAMQSVHTMAADFLAHLRRARPDGPYRLAGYCFGGIVAYEMARQLVEQGQHVDLLALIDGAAPGTEKIRPVGQRLVVHGGNMAQLGPTGAMAYVWTRLRHRASPKSKTSASPGANQPPPAEDSQLHRAIRRIQEAGHLAARAYRPGPYPGAMVLFRATIRPHGDAFLARRPCNGWEAFVRAGIQVHDVPGCHTTIMQEPGLNLVARELERCLAAASGDAP